jgi:hypothetical protein
MPPGKPPIFYIPGRWIRIIILLMALALTLSSLAAYSTSLSLQAEGLVLGRSATYSYDAGNERVRSIRLTLSGDYVTGAQAVCEKVKNDSGNYTVSVIFSNGAESGAGQVTVYQPKGVTTFTVSMTFNPPISYYPSPSISGDCRKVG